MATRNTVKSHEEIEPFETPMDMLEADHTKVKALFDKFESAGDRMTKAKQHIVEAVFAALEVHSQLEEDIFYPAVKALGAKDNKKMIAESTEEHLVVKHLMEEMRAFNPREEQYAAKFTVLMENVRHHIAEDVPGHCHCASAIRGQFFLVA